MKNNSQTLLILGITALLCSRGLFALFDDPEGPNLLIVLVMAAIIYSLSLVVYLFKSSTTDIFQPYFFPTVSGSRRLLLAISTQIIVVAIFYLFLN